jgi:DNA-binding MarR family transcriptional regulator
VLTYFICKAAMHPKYDLIELFFFAYRDFTRDADDCLVRYKYGRAHHRVLHFVHRHPGLTVNELLDILKITKQGFSRLFRDLEAQDFITQKEGLTDRRQRLLSLTPKGTALALELSHLQSKRFDRVMQSPDIESEQISRFLTLMINENEREPVSQLLDKALYGAYS